MTTRTLAGTAAALLAAAGLCRGAASDNQIQPTSPVVAGKAPATIAPPSNPGPAAVGSEWEDMAKAFGGSKADTKPSRDVVMQFTFATEIREITAVGGKKVKKGEVLMRARDADVAAGIASQRDMAENEWEILGTEKQSQLAQFKFDQIKRSGTFSPQEYEEAKISAEVGVVQYEAAKRRKLQEGLKLKTAEAQYLRYWLEAPFDGIVEEVMVEVGEGVTEQTKVLRMVNTDKLWLDPYAKTTETIKLAVKEGSPAWVLVDMPDAPKLVRGRVLYVSPVADSVSQTRRVRVEIDNPQTWPAGTQAMVRFTEPSGEWEKYKVAATAAQSAFPDTATRAARQLRSEVEDRWVLGTTVQGAPVGNEGGSLK